MSYIPERERIYRKADGFCKLEVFKHVDGYYQIEISDYNSHFLTTYNINPQEMQTFIDKMQEHNEKNLKAWMEKNKK